MEIPRNKVLAKANRKDALLGMKNQPAYLAAFALSAPHCMGSLAQLITHLHQNRFKIRKPPVKSKLVPRVTNTLAPLSLYHFPTIKKL